MKKIRACIGSAPLRFVVGVAKRFAGDRCGNVAVMFGMLAIPIFAIAGSSVDFGRAINTQRELSNAIDAAALAAGAAFNLNTNDRIQLAKNYFDENFKASGSAKIGVPNITITKDTITINVNGTVDTSFLGVVGINTINVAATNEVSLRTKKVEVALVLDTTGSMSGSKIATLRTAAKDLIDHLFAGTGAENNVKIGIVPYAGFVNVGTAYESASWLTLDKGDNVYCQLITGGRWSSSNQSNCNKLKANPGNWQGCVRPRDAPKHTVDDPATGGSNLITGIYGECLVENLQILTSDTAALKQKIDDLVADGWTYIPGGLIWGWRILSPNEPFTDVKPYDDKEWVKALVLMTDGDNTLDYLYTGADANMQTSAICENIKAEGVTIYSVAFQISAATTKQLMQNCASKKENYYDASDNEALKAAFGNIAEKLAELRISK